MSSDEIGTGDMRVLDGQRTGLDNGELPLRAEDAVAQLKGPKRQRLEESPATVKSQVVVDSKSVFNSVSQFKRRTAGSVVYEPNKLILTGFELDYNAVVQVSIAGRYLRDPISIQKRALWGTEIYTDDSDIIACLKHQNLLPESPINQDLNVSVLILPALERYRGSYCNELQSRTWDTPHDGVSFAILDVKQFPLGFADCGVKNHFQRLIDLEDLRKSQPICLATNGEF